MCLYLINVPIALPALTIMDEKQVVITKDGLNCMLNDLDGNVSYSQIKYDSFTVIIHPHL